MSQTTEVRGQGSAPRRIQRRRTKGWRLPPNTVCVSRPGRFANPFPWRGPWIVWAAVAIGYRADEPGCRAAAVAFFRNWLGGDLVKGPLAGAGDGGMIEYESGAVVPFSVAARGVAASFAGLYARELEVPKPPILADIRAQLKGKNLACWCGLGDPCHVDVLLEIANA